MKTQESGEKKSVASLFAILAVALTLSGCASDPTISTDVYVYDSQGRPIEGASVSAYSNYEITSSTASERGHTLEGALEATALTDSTGYARMQTLPGQYAFTAAKNGAQGIEEKLVIAENNFVTITLTGHSISREDDPAGERATGRAASKPAEKTPGASKATANTTSLGGETGTVTISIKNSDGTIFEPEKHIGNYTYRYCSQGECVESPAIQIISPEITLDAKAGSYEFKFSVAKDGFAERQSTNIEVLAGQVVNAEVKLPV